MNTKLKGTEPILCAPLIRQVDQHLIELLTSLDSDESSSDACRSSENGRVSARRGSGATGLRASRSSQERSGVENRRLGKKTGLHSAQTARSCHLPTERRRSNSRGSLRIVSGLAENTHSIFCDGPSGPETANGCPVLRRQEPPPRGTGASCGFWRAWLCALLRSARQENLLLLDKRLTWKSANRKLGSSDCNPWMEGDVLHRPSINTPRDIACRLNS